MIARVNKKANLVLTLFVTLLSFTRAQDNGGCKTVTTVEPFDIDMYASAPWYVQQLAEISYQPIENNYCVKAEYTIRDEPTFWGYSVNVNNQAQDENGQEFGGGLCAYQSDDTPSKLAVAPCFLPKVFAGPYWIVAYNETEGYALISGGQPTIQSANSTLCTSGTGINNSGLWIFTRTQQRDQALVDKVRDIAEDAGFDLSVLNDVDQTLCDVCADSVDGFKNFWGSDVDCSWVDDRNFLRCWFYGEHCPETCGLCQ